LHRHAQEGDPGTGERQGLYYEALSQAVGQCRRDESAAVRREVFGCIEEERLSESRSRHELYEISLGDRTGTGPERKTYGQLLPRSATVEQRRLIAWGIGNGVDHRVLLCFSWFRDGRCATGGRTLCCWLDLCSAQVTLR